MGVAYGSTPGNHRPFSSFGKNGLNYVNQDIMLHQMGYPLQASETIDFIAVRGWCGLRWADGASSQLRAVTRRLRRAAGGQHPLIDHALPPVAAGVGDDAASPHPGDRLFDRHPPPADELVAGLLDGVEFTSSRLFPGLEGVAVRRFVALESPCLWPPRHRLGRSAHFRRPVFCRGRGPRRLAPGRPPAFRWKAAGSFCGALSFCRCSFSFGCPGPWVGGSAVRLRR